MSNSQRRKGRAAEQELSRLLSEQLGIAIKRNLAQTRDPGADLALPGWSLEVKRAGTRIRLAEWWQQTLLQAEQVGTRPAMGYGWPHVFVK